MFAKTLITINVLDDACKLLKVGIGQAVKIIFLEKNPLYGMLQSCQRYQKII